MDKGTSREGTVVGVRLCWVLILATVVGLGVLVGGQAWDDWLELGAAADQTDLGRQWFGSQVVPLLTDHPGAAALLTYATVAVVGAVVVTVSSPSHT